MARRRPQPNGTPASLAQLDRQIIELLNARVSHPASKGAELESAAAWKRLCSRIQRTNQGPLSDTVLGTIFRDLCSASRQQQCPVRVSYLGPAYSYSHLAAIRKFGQSAELVPVQTISAVFEEVRQSHCDFGLVPLANSTDGRIADTLDSFARQPVVVSGEVPLRIHHHLLGRGNRSSIQVVYSKPQALSQCRQWLAKHLPQAELQETASTTVAAQWASERPGAAAVASQEAARQYGLDILASNIEDHPENVTRFAVIGGTMPAPTGNDKTALMFELGHEVGALAQAMQVFRRCGLNLTWVESFPMPDTPNEYLFFVEFEGHVEDMAAQQALTALKKKTTRLEVLGCYPRSEPLE